jgi:S-adenosylmethionine uptake transporter
MPERQSPLSGILIALLAFALFAAHDVVIKLLGAGYAVFQIVFFSVLLTFPLVVLMVMRDPDAGTLRPVHPWWTLIRTAAAVATGFCAFYAFTVLPLAQVYAIIFASPMVITVLSIPLLGERVGIHRGGAVVVGLLGVLIVLRPGATHLTLGHAAALVTALMGGLSAVIMRKIGRDERTAVMMLYPMMANFVVMGALLPFVYVPLPLGDLALQGLMAVLAFGASVALIVAYRRAEAVLIAPMQYSQIIWAALYGWLFFDEAIDAGTAIGATVIIASGFYIVLREGRGRSRNAPVLRTRSRPETGTAPRVSPMLTDAAREVPMMSRDDVH